MPLIPPFLSYMLSFVYVGIYWNNHHHMLHATRAGHGRDAVGESAPAVLALAHTVCRRAGWARIISRPAAVGAYGVVLLMSAIAYWILEQLIIASQGPDSILRKAVGGDWKGKLSPILYAIAIAAAFWWQWVSLSLYVVVALLWLIPDRRIENTLRNADP